MGRDQRAELDEVLRLEKAARGPERGDDQQRVADVGVGEAMQLARLVERDRDAGAAAGLHDGAPMPSGCVGSSIMSPT